MARTLHVSGAIILTAVLAVMAVFFTMSSCSCALDEECFCPDAAPVALADVSDQELEALQEPIQSEYRNFLEAWETEFADRNREWTERYKEFHKEDHPQAEADAFDRALRQERRDFVLLFRERHRIFTEQRGLNAE